MSMTRSFVAHACSMLIAVFAASCASSSKDFSKMADDSLIAEVKAVEKKIDEKKVPKFEPTGDATIDALIKPYVDAATENAPKALALVAACRSSAIIELVNKSVDAEFKKQNIASPTSQQRVEVTAKVLKVLKPDERKQWDEWVAKNRKQIEAEKANSAKLGAQAVAVLADLAQKAQAAAQGGMAAAFTGGKAALAANNGIDQINGVKDFTAPADELIARYSDKIAANDKMAVGNMQGK